MIRRIIQIDEEKCNGCGACAKACHEGAISMVNGKAKLMRDDYCDGLGDCLPNCPVDAIHFVEREAAAYDAEAVKQNMLKKQQEEAAKQNAEEGPKAPVKAICRGMSWKPHAYDEQRGEHAECRERRGRKGDGEKRE